MQFDGFDWDHGNTEKCQKHGLSMAETESVFSRPVLVLPDKPNMQGEQRYQAIGTTSAGRRAFIVFALRRQDGETLLRPISARYMHKEEVALYENTYPGL